MLWKTAERNSLLDKLTSRNTAAGPIIPTGFGILIYTGAQLGIDTIPAAYDNTAGVTGLNWLAAAGGVAVLANPINQTGSSGAPAGTLTFAKYWIGASNGTFDVAVGLAGSGAECILSSVTANSGTSGVNVTNLSLKLQPAGDLKMNDLLLNALLDAYLRTGAAPSMGTSGTVKVYSGAAPASAGDAATGTELISFTTSATAWTTASGASATLVGSLNANAIAGSATPVGYARWVKGSYTIQGSVGTAGTTFLMDSAVITSGNSYNLTGATITI